MRAGRRAGIVAAGLLPALLALAPAPAPAERPTRGIELVYRAREEAGAPVAGALRLYARSFALVIGVDGYDAGWPRLTRAVEDAAGVAAALEAQGFEVARLVDPDRDRLEAALARFFIEQGADPEARLLVWFAGHGHSEAGEGFLVPKDAPRPDAGPAFRLKALPVRRFGEYARLARARHVLAIFDSCFSGTVFEAARGAPPAAITRATALPVRQFLTAGDAGQEVADDGAFRELFLRALDGTEPADLNRDGYLTASELGLHLTERLTALSRGSQTPRYGKLRDKDFDRGDFVLAAPAPAPEPEPAPPAAPAGDAPGHRRLELAFWESVKDSRDPAELEAYLARFGEEGVFTRLAVNRLAALRAAARPPAPAAPVPAPDPPAAPSAEAREAALGLDRAGWRAVQAALDGLGLPAGTADGRPGRATRAAIAAWQQRAGAEATGYLTDEQHRRLARAAPATREPPLRPPAGRPPPERTEAAAPPAAPARGVAGLGERLVARREPLRLAPMATSTRTCIGHEPLGPWQRAAEPGRPRLWLAGDPRPPLGTWRVARDDVLAVMRAFGDPASFAVVAYARVGEVNRFFGGVFDLPLTAVCNSQPLQHKGWSWLAGRPVRVEAPRGGWLGLGGRLDAGGFAHRWTFLEVPEPGAVRRCVAFEATRDLEWLGGYHCAAPGERLDEAAATAFLRRIGVEGRLAPAAGG